MSKKKSTDNEDLYNILTIFITKLRNKDTNIIHLREDISKLISSIENIKIIIGILGSLNKDDEIEGDLYNLFDDIKKMENDFKYIFNKINL